MKRYTIGLIIGILLTASALPLIAQEDASGLTLEKHGEQVLIPLGEWVAVSSAYDPSNTVRGIYLGMTVDALRIQQKGESFEREIPMDEIGSIFRGKTKSTKEYVWGGVKLGCLTAAAGGLIVGIIVKLGVPFVEGREIPFLAVPAGALIGYIRGQAAQWTEKEITTSKGDRIIAKGNVVEAVEYVIGEGNWTIVTP